MSVSKLPLNLTHNYSNMVLPSEFNTFSFFFSPCSPSPTERTERHRQLEPSSLVLVHGEINASSMVTKGRWIRPDQAVNGWGRRQGGLRWWESGRVGEVRPEFVRRQRAVTTELLAAQTTSTAVFPPTLSLVISLGTTRCPLSTFFHHRRTAAWSWAAGSDLCHTGRM
jgi:hypothetical protein